MLSFKILKFLECTILYNKRSMAFLSFQQTKPAYVATAPLGAPAVGHFLAR
jgi:hypothetical protein